MISGAFSTGSAGRTTRMATALTGVQSRGRCGSRPASMLRYSVVPFSLPLRHFEPSLLHGDESPVSGDQSISVMVHALYFGTVDWTMTSALIQGWMLSRYAFSCSSRPHAFHDEISRYFQIFWNLLVFELTIFRPNYLCLTSRVEWNRWALPPVVRMVTYGTGTHEMSSIYSICIAPV